jgi:AcrR family transcriptional regulator
MSGMAGAVAERGYAAVTINDVVRHAQISKSTFYAHFSDKEDCFLAAYEAASDLVIDVIVSAADAPVPERARASTDAYLAALAADPALTRVFILDVLAAGPAALAARLEVNRRFAKALRELVAEGPIGELTPESALLLVGGINELVLAALVEDRVADLPALTGTITDLVRAAAADRG